MINPTYKRLCILLLGYFVLLAGLYTIFTFLGFIGHWPKNSNLAVWDANWYFDIRNHGYFYSDTTQSSSGFFPLFPYMWRLLHLNKIGICYFNLILFGASFLFLAKNLNLKWEASVLFVSFPSSVFFMLPFSESLFFCCTVVFLVGLSKENYKMIILGLLLASLTRATAMFFVPAFIAMELFYNRQGVSKTFFKNVLLFTFICVLGIGIVVVIQYYQTGVWFAFAKQQVQFWGHKFRIPGLPLVAWGAARLMWLDGIGVLAGTLAGIIIFYLFFKFLSKQRDGSEALLNNKAYIFSVVYCMMTLVYVLFFNDKAPTGNTWTNSLNRYIFSTAFFPVFLSGTLGHFQLRLKPFIIFTVIALIVFFGIGLGGDLSGLSEYFHSKYRTLIYFFFIYIYGLIIFSFSREYEFKKELLYVLFMLNVILQIYLINEFIQNKWVA